TAVWVPGCHTDTWYVAGATVVSDAPGSARAAATTVWFRATSTGGAAAVWRTTARGLPARTPRTSSAEGLNGRAPAAFRWATTLLRLPGCTSMSADTSGGAVAGLPVTRMST